MRHAISLSLALLLSVQTASAQSAGDAAATVGTPAPPDAGKATENPNPSSVSPSGPQQAAGSNIGLTAYPSPQCSKPQLNAQKPEDVRKETEELSNTTARAREAQAEDYNKQVANFNEAAKSYNAQMAAYNTCAQTYIADANADLHRIHDKLEATVKGGGGSAPAGALAGAGSNIGLTDYPSAVCVKPSDVDGNLKPSVVPPLDASVSEVEAYNQGVTRYNDAIRKHNAQAADYNSCIPLYSENANADMRRIQSALDAAIAGTQNTAVETASATRPASSDGSAVAPIFSDDQQIETVTVEASKLPSQTTIAGFVRSYAAPSLTVDKIPRWARGICPAAEGLTPSLNLGVAALLGQVGARVGAPVAKEPCDTNVDIIFTRTPQAVLDDLAKNHADLLGYHDVSQTKRIATMSHPIQAWYATATRDYNGNLVMDKSEKSLMCQDAQGQLQDLIDQAEAKMPPRPPPDGPYHDDIEKINKWCGGLAVSGSRVTDGLRSEFFNVTIIVDGNKVQGMSVGSVAHYVAMLALSQTQAFETCQPLASIANLMTPGCDAVLKTDTLSSNDIAYLSALYRMNPDVMLVGQRSDIAHQMEAALGGN